MTSFTDHVAEERGRLQQSRNDLTARMDVLRGELSTVDQELRALDAYETTRKGETRRPAGGARGAQRETLLSLINGSPQGLSRAEILNELGLKSDRKRAAAISSALMAMKKAGKVRAVDGRYQTA